MRKIVFAVGGTGGHLFPAQALARELKEAQSDLEVVFGGGRLGSNRFFHKLQFPFREITSSTPFRSNPLKAVLALLKGIRESLALFKEFSPDLIVGFGSFYSFPLLAAAKLKNIPYILVESNALPGKVNRLFASGAKLCALQFEEASRYLKGKTTVAKMPFWSREHKDAYLITSEARKYFGLESDPFTLLVFGGSQGARRINEALLKLELTVPYQVLHFCGRDQDAEALKKEYETQGIFACVKPFEEKMHLAWRAADLAICRAGASTLSELIEYAIPGILIPWPGASERHQHKNARVMEDIGGAILLDQEHLHTLAEHVERAKDKLVTMRDHLKKYRDEEKDTLCKLVLNQLESYQIGKDDEEGRFGKVAASPNSQKLTERGIR
ncbi:MAG: UDP-N-acetylglucosamine--N-acetylmuramyl-(pentapeptide) pyrophosphoryl-undecaprenol N-acetylglucosamine transferase [Chlamydiae bacterium]|nr:UDP-N-acetylglucosamine--N-acetylmuramyl-(pentapeptide) pyrophosphoryl-undecaprenol N-acetylglucosamine transferase [Chlamydiota bacterium]